MKIGKCYDLLVSFQLVLENLWDLVIVFVAGMLNSFSFLVRYVVRAKAGKKQSSKDGGGRAAHSAGASLRRYNELALKKVSSASVILELFGFCYLLVMLYSFYFRHV